MQVIIIIVTADVIDFDKIFSKRMLITQFCMFSKLCTSDMRFSAWQV